MIAHKCVGMYSYCHGCGAMLEFDRFDLEFPDEDRPISETLIPHFGNLQVPRKDVLSAKKEAEENKLYWTDGYIMCPICGHREKVMRRGYEVASFADAGLWTVEWNDAFKDLNFKHNKTLGEMVSECEACPSGEEFFLDNVEFLVEI